MPRFVADNQAVITAKLSEAAGFWLGCFHSHTYSGTPCRRHVQLVGDRTGNIAYLAAFHRDPDHAIACERPADQRGSCCELAKRQ